MPHSSKRLKTDSSAWTSKIETTTISELLSKRTTRLIYVHEKDGIGKVLDTLEKSGIRSVPVVSDTHVFLGIVDVVDIAGYALATYRQAIATSHVPTPHVDSRQFFERRVSDVLEFGHHESNRKRFIYENASVADAIHAFCKPLATHTHTHRLAVLDTKSRLINILSQTDIVIFAQANLDIVNNASVALSELQLFRHPIVVQIDTAMSEALAILYRNRVGGVALVDQEYHLRGCLSASDLRGVHTNFFDLFNCSVLTFLAKATESPLQAPITLPESATLGEAIQLLVGKQIHRAFVADNSGHPRAVVTMTDIVQQLEKV